MKSRPVMWKYVLPPVLVVTMIWGAMSGATTIYVQWIEQSHQKILDENVASLNSAAELQRVTRRLERFWALAPETDSTKALLKTTVQELKTSEAALRRSSLTEPEQRRMLDIEEHIRVIDQRVASRIERDSSTDHDHRALIEDQANAIVELADELKVINQQLIDDGAAYRSQIQTLVGMSRGVLLLAGPLVGVWLGWRLSQRLQRWVGHLAVTLQQTDSPSIELGTVLIPSDGMLDELQLQAEAIVGRLKESQAELDQTRAEVIRSERLAAVGQLAAGVAHELRNPLTSVKLLLQHASRRGGGSALKEDQLQLILDEIGRMESTIGGLLDFSREQPLKVTCHDFRETVQRALTLVEARARHQKIQVELQFPDAPVTVCGDIELLHQVLVNLCINSIESMTAGGVLIVRLQSLADQGRIRVTVQDTGTGIEADMLPRLFEPFATTKERGTGLGLAVSRRIVIQHHGTLQASNVREGNGAVFTMELPTNSDTTAVLGGFD